MTGLVRVGLVEVWLDRVGFTLKGRGGMVRLAGIEGLVDVGLVFVVRTRSIEYCVSDGCVVGFLSIMLGRGGAFYLV